MMTNPFLTALDSRAAVKGSRDPLGIQQIWTRLGRHIVGNLTTVSDSTRDFTVTLLGHHFASVLAEQDPGTELATFIKWEQLAAYARGVVNGDWAFRGTERVRKNLSESSKVMISDEPGHQILGSQKIYGLWGLYTVPARSSGWLEGSPARLTLEARSFLEAAHLPPLKGHVGQVLGILSTRSRIEPNGRHRSLLEAIAKVLRRPVRTAERPFYRDHLLYGGPADDTAGRQRQMVQLLEPDLDDPDFGWSATILRAYAKEARLRPWPELAERLDRIRVCESVVAPVSMAFSYMLTLDGRPLRGFADDLRRTWGARLRTADAPSFAVLRDEIGREDPTIGKRWVSIAESVGTGEYDHLAKLLIDQNRSVMSARGGTSWIEVRNGKVRVRFRDEQGRLPARDELPSLWRFPYFLESLRRIASQLRARP